MIARRILGGALLVGAFAPMHRLLDPTRAGPAAAATKAITEAAWVSGLSGTAIVVGLAYVASRLFDPARLGPVGAPLVDRLTAGSDGRFALVVGAAATLFSGGIARFVHHGAPTSVDEMVQLAHAWALATGALVIPDGGAPAAVALQNGWMVDGGWASIYPPGHTLLLTAGVLASVPWLVGPLAIGVATSAASMAFSRLLPSTEARAAGVALAVTPFWLLLGATHLSHATAAAGLALVAWLSLAASRGGVLPSLALGAAIGLSVTSRPWVGLVGSAALVAGAWWPVRAEHAFSEWARRAVAVVVGGLPFAALLLAWNASIFGDPFLLGYSAAFGPAHGLGLHVDPWGNAYGVVEAAAYTGADLLQLGARLWETPIPAVALAGAGLLIARPPAFFALWVGAAIAANALYWHHGSHFGPRMLFESTPAWVALTVAGTAAVARRGALGAWVAILAVVGALLLAPGVLLRPGPAPASAPLPAVAERPAVVFVHGSWASRVAGRLVAAGMRRDSVETALRRNPLCSVDRFARWRSAEVGGAEPPLDLESLPGSPPHLAVRLLSPGNAIRIDPTEPWDATCEREARSDRLGVQEVEPLVAQAPLDGSVLYVRDLGPLDNARYDSPGRSRWVWLGDESGSPRLLPYDEGMELLWRGSAGTPIR